MKALLGIGSDGTIGLIASNKHDDATDDDMLASAKELGPTGWKNMVVLDDELSGLGASCRLRRVETRITG